MVCCRAALPSCFARDHARARHFQGHAHDAAGVQSSDCIPRERLRVSQSCRHPTSSISGVGTASISSCSRRAAREASMRSSHPTLSVLVARAAATPRWNAIAQARSPMECDSTRVVTCAGPGAYASETFSCRVEGDLAAQFCQRTTSRWQSWMRRGGLRWRTCASRPRAEGRRWGRQEVPNSR